MFPPDDIMSKFNKATVMVGEILVLKDACNPLYLLCELLKDLQQHLFTTALQISLTSQIDLLKSKCTPR